MYDSEGEGDEEFFSALPQRTVSSAASPAPRPLTAAMSQSTSGRPIITTTVSRPPVPSALPFDDDHDHAHHQSHPDRRTRARVDEPRPPSAGGSGGYTHAHRNLTSSVGQTCTLPENEQAFEEDLRNAHGFIIKRMLGDGNCLFRAVANQVFGDPEMHDEVRKRCMDHMERDRDHYSQFVAEDFNEYIRRKRRDKEYGNHVEIQAISEIYNRPIEVYAYGHRDPINIFHKHYFTEYAPIRLSYHYGNHYNSVIDPENPSVGVGLGLPQLSNPALEMERAIEQSIEDSLYKDVIASSEMEATQKQLEEQIRLQSALEAGFAPPTTPNANVSREGDIFMDNVSGTTEEEQLAAILRQSALEYWEAISRNHPGS